jgi:hypothetical protein
MIGSNVFGQAQGYQSQAGRAYSNLANFQAPKVSGVSSGGRYDPTAVSAGTLAGTDYQQYINPYTQQVIERSEQDIARQREQALNALGAQATAAGAFGGSRQGIAEGETYGQYGRMAADLAAQQRQAAFQQAQQAAQFDIGTQYEAQLANELARQQAFENAAQRGLTAGTANQQAAMDAARMQMSAMQTGAAGLTGLGSQVFGQGMRGIEQQQRAAALAQQQQQQMLDAARMQTLMNLGYPGQALQTGTGILGGLPSAAITQAGSPGLFGILSGIGSLPFG